MTGPVRLAVVTLSLAAAGAAAQNLHPNPDFNDDQGTAGWVVDPGFLHHGDADASGCPASGYLRASTEEIVPLVHQMHGKGPCVTFAEAATVEVRFLYHGLVSGLFDSNTAAALVFAEDDCIGTPLVEESVFFTGTFDWEPFAATLAVPANGAVQLELTSGGDDGGGVEVDEIRLTLDPPLLLDDFEGGGTCRWSSSVV